MLLPSILCTQPHTPLLQAARKYSPEEGIHLVTAELVVVVGAKKAQNFFSVIERPYNV
jgi:hypothetical protein